MQLDIFNKIYRWVINKQATEDEIAALKQWQKESKDNMAALEQMRKIHRASEDMLGYKQYDADKAFSKFEAATTQNVRSMWHANLRKIAAIAVLVTGLLGFYLYQNSTLSETIVANQSSIIKQIQLEDGTQVELDKGASLTVLDDRSVKLDGRAYFSVTKSANKDKFTITTDKAKITVLGTKFSVNTNIHHYEVIVDEGHVVFESGNKKVDLLQNEAATLIDNDLVKSTVSSSNQQSWKTNNIVFDNTSLMSAISQINRHYNVEIKLDKNAKISSKCVLTSKYTKESIEDILQEWKTLFGLDYKVEQGIYTIVKINC